MKLDKRIARASASLAVRRQRGHVLRKAGRSAGRSRSGRLGSEDVTAFRHFPTSHWKKIWSTDSLERVDEEIERRTDVAGVFPNPAGLLRLAGAVLLEQHEEWDISERRYLAETGMNLLDPQPEEVTTTAPAAA